MVDTDLIEVTKDTAYCYLKLQHDQRIAYRRLLTPEKKTQLAQYVQGIADNATMAAEIIRRER